MAESHSLQPKCVTNVQHSSSRNPHQCECASSQSSFESVSSDFLGPPKRGVKTMDFQNVPSLLQEPSSITGENLLDHLTEIIKRIIDERPLNVIDYFEQFSRDVRRQTFIHSDSSADRYKEPQFLDLAEAVLKPLKLPETIDSIESNEYLEYDEEQGSQLTVFRSSDSSIAEIQRDLQPNENVLQHQHLWAFCGLGFQVDEIFQLAWAVQKVQHHPTVENARFWGRIYGLSGSYFIVEATLTKTETAIRSKRMKSHLVNEMVAYMNRREQGAEIYSNLMPGSSWQYYSKGELQRMQHKAAPIPQLKVEQKLQVPAELVGLGLNERTYFVSTSLSDEWQELPVVTPKQVQSSKKIKKYFTGNLETELSSYPPFPGTEKNYLRAMIARITSGVCIAPRGYYRPLTKKERAFSAGHSIEEDYDGEGDYTSKYDEGCLNNDTTITENSDYKPLSLEELVCSANWVHVRPNILEQGRVLYIDEESAIKDLKKQALSKLKSIDALDQDGLVEESENEDKEGLLDEEQKQEPDTGPQLFAACSGDANEFNIPPWTSRYSSLYDTTNQMILMRSNLWPGAYSYASGKFSDSIYLGWGFKYVSRYTCLEKVSKIQDIDCPDVAGELTDPTVEMEEKWRLFHLKKDTVLEEMSDLSVDYEVDDEEDEGL